MLDNPWVKYVDRSYRQIKDAVLAKFPISNPEMTDHTESNPFIRLLSVWAGLMEMVGYYSDNNAREAFLATARQWKSGVAHAKSRDYRIRAVIPATVDLKAYLVNSSIADVVIPAGTEIATREGVIFRTVNSATIVAGQLEVTISCSNIIPETGQLIGISNGIANQLFILGEDVADSQVEIIVGGDTYLPVSSFGKSLSEDKHFIVSVDANRQVYVLFGDGVNGMVPPNTSDIVANYFLSSGAEGNVGALMIINLQTVLSLPPDAVLRFKNVSAATGGNDIESLVDLQKKIPLNTATLDRAVTPDDYRDVALLCNGVAQAVQAFKCGKVVPIYIVPNGGGLATNTLLKNVELWFEDKRMTTTKVDAVAAGIIEVVLDIDAVAKPNFFNASASANLMTSLLEAGSVENQEIGGSVYIGDLYQVTEGAEGVKRTVINTFSFKPAAIGQGIDTVLLWSRSVSSSANEKIAWRLRVISGTQYQLFRSNLFKGNFLFGTEYTVNELTFNVTYDGAYVVGDIWDFKTYSVTKSLELDEFSIPLIFEENVTIRMTGGL